MKTSVLIEKLKASKGPDRALDGYIAMVAGFKKMHDVISDKRTGIPVKRTLWIGPAGEKFVPVPYYTENIDDARDLALQISNGEPAGLSWRNGDFSAVINGGPVCHAASPALALCLAALNYSLLANNTGPPATS